MDELHDKIMDVVHEEGRELDRGDYRELLQLIRESCQAELRAMDQDGEDEEDED